MQPITHNSCPNTTESFSPCWDKTWQLFTPQASSWRYIQVWMGEKTTATSSVTARCTVLHSLLETQHGSWFTGKQSPCHNISLPSIYTGVLNSLFCSGLYSLLLQLCCWQISILIRPTYLDIIKWGDKHLSAGGNFNPLQRHGPWAPIFSKTVNTGWVPASTDQGRV